MSVRRVKDISGDTTSIFSFVFMLKIVTDQVLCLLE